MGAERVFVPVETLGVGALVCVVRLTTSCSRGEDAGPAGGAGELEA